MSADLAAQTWVCSECSATAAGVPSRHGCGLPLGWEHHDPTACRECVSMSASRPAAEAARVVCASCIGRLLDLLLAAFAKASR